MTLKTTIVALWAARRRAVLVLLTAGLLAPAAARAQAVPAPAPSKPASGSTNGAENQTVLLDPFEVVTQKDTSYGALNSNSISAFNMELLKTPVAADIFTEEFMRDVGTTSVEDLLNGYGAGVGQVLATPDSDSNNNQPGDRFSTSQVGSRGLTAGATRRDGFNATSTRTSVNDTFDTERVEVIKGANALLFGASGAGGFANTGSKTAKFGSGGRPNTTAGVTYRIDQFGSKRWEFDANAGLEKFAVRFVALDEDQNYRRLYINSKTHAYYGALSAQLPLHTLLKLSARKTDNNRIIPTRVDDLSFTNATRDPRHNFSLLYLLATNQAGAINPKTGQPFTGTAIDPATGRFYQAGAIVGGLLNYDNASSWSGWSQSEDNNAQTYTLTADTVWAKWLATSVGAMYDYSYSQRGPDGGALLAPRTFNSTNPFDTWANSSSFRMDRPIGKNQGYRANAVLTNELFRGRAKSQTVIGYDLNLSTGGNVNYQYYEADANFRIYDFSNPRPASLANSTSADQLGRYGMPTIFWQVANGPVKKPGFRTGSRQVLVGDRHYVLVKRNPRNPGFVSANNPLGLASLAPGFTGIGGTNSELAEDDRDYGLYGANYTKWLDERFTTLIGYRLTKTFTRRPNTSLTGTQPWNDTAKSNKSFNVGFTYRLKPWLYGYYNIGQTFNPSKGAQDFNGNPPRDTEGFSQEIGLKYEPAHGRVSGSITYYQAKSKNEAFRYSGTERDLVNPVGIDDAFNASTRNQWINLDKKSSGLEVILTAAPTRNWRARLGFTQQDGRILTSTHYPLLWNDEFAYNKTTGGVTYTDGTPFIVPTDAAGIAAVNGTSTLHAPVVGATNTQLTIGMMSDPNSDYYAYGKGSAQQANGRIANNSTVFRALRWFQTPAGIQSRTLRTGLPISSIPYTFSDPIGYHGYYAVSESGEPTIGHPLYRLVVTNTVDLTEGRLRGVTIGGTMRWDVDKRTYWYLEPNGAGGNVRKLYKEVNVNPQISPFLSYKRKIGRYGFRTQLNVNNIFNKYRVDLRPSAATGFSNETNVGATFVGEPRQYVWTNSVTF